MTAGGQRSGGPRAGHLEFKQVALAYREQPAVERGAVTLPSSFSWSGHRQWPCRTASTPHGGGSAPLPNTSPEKKSGTDSQQQQQHDDTEQNRRSGGGGDHSDVSGNPDSTLARGRHGGSLDPPC
ncbi:hypothetical protein JOB18_042233 [Solea senegalensis]|uniref:Uncharacterized protein n=1 Tax=Solea senegalensis TaxID=28829 RepID=A0AAV6RDX5_SOLSE|nr:hypothetical protein JOB18_042233 [Solea senegalensis]